MPKSGHTSFRLYVVSGQTNSIAALANLKAMCDAFLSGQSEIEVIDVRREPKRALLDGIIMIPTLVMLSPGPVRRIVGTFRDPQTLAKALGLEHPR